ncbi:uncharacterized protein N7487_004361, partial [Penicillium crustosum]|uniref:uncharacterized protein n=1 Tax=Penicillium crustosum TaxID=36656 RepID=UPI00239BFF85
GPSKLPEIKDRYREVPPSVQASSAENTSVSSYKVSQPNHDTIRNNLSIEPFQPVLKILK